jgi:ABC-type branched-subunit amino acid transport system ATPase component
VAARGLARTFQISRIFGHMTVWENMLVVARQRSERDSQATADALLRRVDLYDFREHFGADLSYGQQRLLEVIRCLMLEPSVILLDEPFAGVNPTMAQTVVGLIRELRNEGKTVFIIDHAMTIIMSLCERILVLDMGELIADGPPSELQSNERVLEAYFGRARRTSLP